ncbi:MAG TPA: DUF6515 family protein [Burkholderiales bacterium]|nr:DUF6515 family protein [Burkholderiales bacterium]
MKKEIFGVILLALVASAAQAQYRSPHWAYDDRYGHHHYYPAIGYPVVALPPGYLSISYGGGRYYFHAGVWFRPSGPSYVVVRPPVGIVVPVLPPSYNVVYAGGQPYYYANDTYYTQMQGGAGYAVVAPPQGAEPTTVTSVPPPASSPQPGQMPSSAAQPAAGSWFYCESAKGYYPYVSECKEGWRQVPATPPH